MERNMFVDDEKDGIWFFFWKIVNKLFYTVSWI